MNTTRVIIVAVGGQGNLLASRVLGEAALLADIPIRMSEIHGMAQRGGVVESAIIFGDVKSSIISDGEADVLVGFEPSETLRAIQKCNEKTIVITNLSPLMPFTVNIGKGVYPDLGELQDLFRDRAGDLIAFNAASLARQAGNVMAVNMVLLGALLQTGMVPLTREQIQEAIRTKTKKAFVETNLTAFDLGFSVAAGNLSDTVIEKEE
ncbi:MAG: indolepyruvate oxidoreductase subunit beta [Deltaproteobacteria bacterium]|nr:indolepyruvate oxidoreductase subunit beta [Deltaproteobacteria bacterium]